MPAAPRARTAASIFALRERSMPKLICREACSNLADRFHHARDHRLDLVGRANPGAARCDLAVERERTQPAHRGVVVAVILRGGAARPIADRLGERAKIFLEGAIARA